MSAVLILIAFDAKRERSKREKVKKGISVTELVVGMIRTGER